jgi:hypothetical protein
MWFYKIFNKFTPIQFIFSFFEYLFLLDFKLESSLSLGEKIHCLNIMSIKNPVTKTKT